MISWRYHEQKIVNEYNPVKNLLIHCAQPFLLQTIRDLQNGQCCGDLNEQYGLDFHDFTNIWVDLFTGNDFKWWDFIFPSSILVGRYVPLMSIHVGRYVCSTLINPSRQEFRYPILINPSWQVLIGFFYTDNPKVPFGLAAPFNLHTLIHFILKTIWSVLPWVSWFILPQLSSGPL